jgi:hypothetical protein
MLAGILGVTTVPAALAQPERLDFTQLYKSFGVLGAQFSDRLMSLREHAVAMRGYMAPPLKAESNFFVLTRQPMALCPFCQSDADWPIDIVVVYLRFSAPTTDPNYPIDVSGRLQVGSWTDPDTAFVSQIRIVDATFRRA